MIRGFFIRFLDLLALSMNPWLMAQVHLQAGRNIKAALSSQSDRVVDVSVPFYGRWVVWRGGWERRESHSWTILSQRFAVDFVPESVETPLEVVSPMNGVVIHACDHHRDHDGPFGSRDWRARSIYGNHVVIQSQDDVFCLIAHLQRGSLNVVVGQQIGIGQRLGVCGNSGLSYGKHIHMHVQQLPHYAGGRGLPMRFVDCEFIPANDGSWKGAVLEYAPGARTSNLPAIEPTPILDLMGAFGVISNAWAVAVLPVTTPIFFWAVWSVLVGIQRQVEMGW